MFKNEDANSKDYFHLKDIFRPSHIDFTYQKKYGLRDYRCGGRTLHERSKLGGSWFTTLQILSEVGVSIKALC